MALSCSFPATLMEKVTTWDKLTKTGDNLKIHKTLSDAEAKRVAEAIDILKAVQAAARRKKYKQFLYDVLRILGPQGVLLCAVAYGQAKVADMKNEDRVGLLHKIEVNKDHTNINHPALHALAVQYKIPSEPDISQLPPPIADMPQLPPPVTDQQLQKRKRDVREPQQQGEIPESGTGDMYELTFEDVQTVTVSDQIRGRIWLMDTYDANTTPFITVPISWKLRDEFISKRQKLP